LYVVDIQTLESYFDKQRRQQEKGRDMISQIQVLSDSLRTNHDHLTLAIQEEVQAQVKKGLTRYKGKNHSYQLPILSKITVD
jgi:hypothetical protein